MEKKFLCGDLKMPSDIDDRPQFLGAIGKPFRAPTYVDLRGYCTKTKSQGSLPWCAAYSATSMMESILWRRNDYVDTIDPTPVYKFAKTIDGDPNGDGTTLNACLEYFIRNNYFVKDAQIQYIHGGDVESKIRYAVHKFGCVHAGFQVDQEWFLCNRKKTSITGRGNYAPQGGHAVLICGVTPDGCLIQNSWDTDWSLNGFALVTWNVVRKQFIYGCVVSHALDGLKMNV